MNQFIYFVTGFGHALAKRLDFLGFTVFAGCYFPNEEGAKALSSSTTGRLHVLPLDVSGDESVAKCVQYVQIHSKEKGKNNSTRRMLYVNIFFSETAGPRTPKIAQMIVIRCLEFKLN